MDPETALRRREQLLLIQKEELRSIPSTRAVYQLRGSSVFFKSSVHEALVQNQEELASVQRNLLSQQWQQQRKDADWSEDAAVDLSGATVSSRSQQR